MDIPPIIKENRSPKHPIHPLLISRYSPRALSGESISDNELNILFEAARWAPSSYNSQPWRFIYAKRDSDHWEKIFNLLSEFNQKWCKNAAVLLIIISQKNFEHNGTPNVTGSFTSGAAMENLMLQATSMRLIAHGMSGFDYDKARIDLKIPDNYEINAMVAVGKPGNIENLPESMHKGETPNNRKDVNELVFEGSFRN